MDISILGVHCILIMFVMLSLNQSSGSLTLLHTGSIVVQLFLMLEVEMFLET